MPYRVVTIYDDEAGWSRVAVVKTLEDDPSVWGVVGWYATTYAARIAADGMSDERARLSRAEREMGGARYTSRKKWPPHSRERAGGLDGPNKEVTSMGNLQ